jgi:hypothetical protein
MGVSNEERKFLQDEDTNAQLFADPFFFDCLFIRIVVFCGVFDVMDEDESEDTSRRGNDVVGGRYSGFRVLFIGLRVPH